MKFVSDRAVNTRKSFSQNFSIFAVYTHPQLYERDVRGVVFLLAKCRPSMPPHYSQRCQRSVILAQKTVQSDRYEIGMAVREPDILPNYYRDKMKLRKCNRFMTKLCRQISEQNALTSCSLPYGKKKILYRAEALESS